MNNKLQPTSHERPRFAKATQGERVTGHGSRKNAASALILAVVLTSLLAIIGVMFVMIARVDKMATSAISENKELNFAVETIVAKISQELALDVPRTDSNGLKLSEYYDYPGEEDKWLASLEPYEKTAGNYYWRQISDVTGFLNDKGFSTQDVNVKPVGLSTTVYVREYPEITLDGNDELKEQSADADGDGIADSKWIKLDNITSNKGKPIYAAIRIVDNGGVLNVNTAYKFDPADANLIDGSSQLQIDLEKLARGSDTIDGLADARNPLRRPLSDYQDEVIWKIEDPCSDYLPFDISDELELRNRFFLTSLAKTRLEATWNSTIGSETFKRVPYDSDMVGWFRKFDPDSNEPDRRHLLTTCNMDRIIDPDCNKMTNINKADAYSIYRAVKSVLDPNFVDANGVAAQIAVNLVDFRDGATDPNVTTLDVNGITYYGFERPCIYISELAHRFQPAADPNADPNVYRSYAVELYKPYFEDDDPNNWRLVIDGNPISIDWSLGSRLFNVIRFEDPCTPVTLAPPLLDVPFNDPNDPPDPNHSRFPYDGAPYSAHFSAGSVISLTRRVGSVDIVVDSTIVPGPNDGWWAIDGIAHSIQRDITLHKCIRRLWDSDVKSPTLGRSNAYSVGDSIYIQAHPANEDFTNIGEIGMLFRKDVYSDIVRGAVESDVRLDLTDPNFQQLFKYLTVFDPTKDNIDNDGDGEIDETDPNKTLELKVPGRININTAPWYVLAQLPWVSQRVGYNNPALAQAIVAYRDKLDLSSTGGPDYYYSGASNSRELETGITGISEANGFRSIGELMNVINKSGKTDYDMRYYTLGAASGKDLTTFPDLTPGDGAADDFEEQDVIFARISNLVTVRSDVFTAYILVRIGTDGPQKRAIAILDRSNVRSGNDKVRIVALHPVPDPR